VKGCDGFESSRRRDGRGFKVQAPSHSGTVTITMGQGRSMSAIGIDRFGRYGLSSFSSPFKIFFLLLSDDDASEEVICR